MRRRGGGRAVVSTRGAHRCSRADRPSRAPSWKPRPRRLANQRRPWWSGSIAGMSTVTPAGGGPALAPGPPGMSSDTAMAAVPAGVADVGRCASRAGAGGGATRSHRRGRRGVLAHGVEPTEQVAPRPRPGRVVRAHQRHPSRHRAHPDGRGVRGAGGIHQPLRAVAGATGDGHEQDVVLPGRHQVAPHVARPAGDDGEVAGATGHQPPDGLLPRRRQHVARYRRDHPHQLVVGEAPTWPVAPQASHLDLAEQVLRAGRSPVGAQGNGQPLVERRRDVGRDAVQPEVGER